MDERRWARVKELVTLALELPTADRQNLLETESDAAIRAEATELIAASRQVGGTDELQSPFEQISRATLETDTRVGPWRLQEQVGIGGMGTVYRAVRADGAYERTVALKLLHHGADPAELARRLRAERNVLARLEHPHIARLYDGGVTGPEYAHAIAVPYLAMEYVEGEKITDFARHKALNVREKIRLFLQVCDAVAYAHRNLIVHRDLKPSNILVNADGQCRLLDFGIAKLLADSGDDVLITRTAIAAMTPAYAAPEQIRHESITTATDVYSLGILLYQLLTETRPYDLSELSPAEIERTICVDTPARPSAVSGRSALSGDLDTIVMKALAKEPVRRYASAEALGDDLLRFVDGLPILARVPTTGYRIRKFIVRNRTLSAAATMVVLALLSGFTVALWQARVADSERDAAQAAATHAQEESDRAEAVSDFLTQILRAPNDSWYVESNVKGPDVPIRAVLDEAAVRVDRDFADRPLLRADLHNILGETYGTLGLLEKANHHHGIVLSLREELYMPPHPKIAEALYYLASTLGSSDVVQRGDLLWRAVEMQRQKNEGNNFPFMVEGLLTYLHWGGAEDVARRLLVEAEAFTDTSFVEGRDSYRYRNHVNTIIAMWMVEIEIAAEDAMSATLWLARGDSVLALIAPAARSPYWQQLVLLSKGRVKRLEGKYHEAEEILLFTYAATNGDKAPAGSQIRLEDWAGYALAQLYGDWGRPGEAERYLANVAAVDSVKVLFEDWVDSVDFGDLSSRPADPETSR